MKSHIIRIMLIVVLGGALGTGGAEAQNVNYDFHWNPSPEVDSQGNSLPAAVAYQVYVKRGSAPEELVATVADTLYTLSAEPGVVQRLLVRAIDASGRTSRMSPASDPIYFESFEQDRGGDEMPPVAEIRRNYPNPFNPETRIVYGVPAGVTGDEAMRLEIYNVQGQLVRRLDVDPTPGWHEAVWDGRNQSGSVEPTGMYLSRFSVGSMVSTNKMTMIK